MTVDLLTNALVPKVGPASQGPELLNGKPIGPCQSDSATCIGRGDRLTSDNNRIEGSSDSSRKKPSKNFADTLERKIQARSCENAEKPDRTEAVAGEGKPSPEELEPVQFEALPEVPTEMGKIIFETADPLQQQAEVFQDPQLLTDLLAANPQEATIGQSSTPQAVPDVQSSEQFAQLTLQQGQMHVQAQQTSEDLSDATQSSHLAHNAQFNANSGSGYEDSSAKPEVAIEDKTGKVLADSLQREDKNNGPVQSVENAAAQNHKTIANADAILKDSPDAGKDASSDPQDGPPNVGPNLNANAFVDAKAGVNLEEQNKTLPQTSENSGKTVLGNEETDSTESTPREFNPAQVESVASHSNVPQSAPTNAETPLEFEQAIPAEAPHQMSAPQQSSVIQTQSAPVATAPGENSAAISEQIRESITSSSIGPDREITIRLNPPELGTVVIRFQEQENQITGILEVSKSQTRAEIQQVLPEITRDLQDFGVQIRRIEVVMAADHEGAALGGQSATPQEDPWAGWEDAQGSDAKAPAASAGGAFHQNTAYAGSAAYSQAYVTDKSIDMFV